MDRECSSKAAIKPVDDRPGREPPLPRGSGGHGVNEMKANNVLRYFSTSRKSHRARSERQQRSHRRRS